MADDNVFLIRTAISLAGLQRDLPRLLSEISRIKQTVDKGGGLTSFAGGIDNLKKKQQEFGRSVRGDGFDHMSRKIGESDVGAGKLNKSLSNTSNTIADVGRRVFIWGSLSAAIFGAFQSAKEFLNITIKINSAMAELKKVMPAKEDFEFIKKEAFTFAIEFGRDPLDVINTLKIFAQAGLKTADALKATEAALVAVNATGATTEQAVSAMIGAARIFNISWDNMGNVIDKVMRIQADYAVDAKDLITSITAIGPAITILGGDIDDLFAMIATLGETARISGKEASNSLKRIFARIPSEEGIEALQDVKIAVMATADSYRPLRDIFKDIGDAWDGLTDVEKTNLSVTLAQVRHYPKFIALVKNYGMVQEGLKSSMNAFGDASKANRIEMATYEKRIASAKAQTTEFFEGLYNAGVAETFTSLQRGLGFVSSQLNKLPKDIVYFTTAALSLIAVMKGLSLAVRGFTAANAAVFGATGMFGMLKLPFTKQGAFWKDYTRSVGEGKNAISASIPKMSRFAGMLGVIGIAAAVLIPIIYKIVDAHKKYGLSLDEAKKHIDKFKESLKDVDIAGVLTYDTERKFNKIRDAFKDFSEILKKTGDESKAFKDAFSGIFAGVDLSNIGVEELKKLRTVVTDLHNLATKQLAESIENQVILITKSIAKNFKDAIKKMEEDAGKGGTAIGKAFGEEWQKIGRYGAFGPAWLTNIFHYLFDKAGFSKNLRRETFFLIGQIDSSRKSMEEAAKSAGISVGQYFDNLFDNYEKAIRKAAEFSKAMRESTSFDFPALEIDYYKAIDESAEAYSKMFNIQGLVITSMEEMGLKFKEGYKPMDDIGEATKESKTRFEELARAEVNAALAMGDMARATELWLTVLGKADEAEKAQKFWVIALSPTTIASAIKKSNNTIISGYNAQIEVIKKVAEVSEKAGVSYDKYTEALKASEQATKAIISSTKQNAAEVEKLKLEQEAIIKLLAVDITGTGIQDTDKEALRKRLEAVKLELLITQAIMEINAKNQGANLTGLQKNTGEYEKAVELEKQRGLAIKGNADLLKDLLQGTIDYNKSITSAPMIAFEANEKIFKSILNSQKASVDETVKKTKLSEAEGKTAKSNLDREYEIEKALRAQNVLMEVRKKGLDSIKKLAGDYRDINVEIKQKMAESILELKKLGKERYRDDILSLELKAIKDRISAEKEGLILNYKVGDLTEKEYQNKLLSLDAEESKLAALAKVNDILEKQKKIYSGITEDTNSIKSTITDWFSNQKALLDDLQSRGSLRKIFGRLFEGVQQIIANRDAQIIAEAITGNVQSYVEKVRGGITEGIADATVRIGNAISEATEGNQLPAALQKAIEDPASFMITGTKEAIISGWEHVASVYFPALSKTIIDAFMTPFETGMQYKPQATAVGIGSSGLTGDFYSDFIKLLHESRGKAVGTKTEESTNRSVEKTEKSNENILKNSALHLEGILREEDLLSRLATVTMEGSVNIVKAILDMSPPSGRDYTGPLGAYEVVKAEKDAADLKKAQNKALTNALIRQVGYIANTAIMSSMMKSGYKQDYMQAGSSLGAILGSYGGPVGTAVGGILGGLLGGLLGGKKDDEVKQDIRNIRDNTAAMVDRLSPSIFHAPSDFILPSGGGFGSVTVNNVFHISGGNASGVAETLESQLNDLYNRSTKRNTILR